MAFVRFAARHARDNPFAITASYRSNAVFAVLNGLPVVTFSDIRHADFNHVFATKLLLAIFVRMVATTWTIKQDIFFRIETVAFFSFVLLTFYPCIGYS